MSRIQVSYLNVAMPSPHSPDRYVELLRTVLRRRLLADLRGDFKGMLGSVRVDQGLITGEIYRFFDLDLNKNWFNTEKQKKAEDDELAEIKVPPNLKPHLQTLDYVFFPRKHRLAFVSRDGRATLSPRQAESMFQTLFSSDPIAEKFGGIDVTVEPRREQLFRILRMPMLRRLRVEVKPPNPDDLDKAEKDLLDRLEALNAKRMVVELAAPRNQSLNIDDEAEVLAKIAQSNGKVEGEGRDQDGKKLVLSTVTHPLVEDVFYDGDVQPRLAALVDQASRTVKDL